MLPASQRLLKKKDFEFVFLKGVRLRSTCFFLRAVKTKLPVSRIGFIVSKKVSLKATQRNLAKRRLRKAVGDNIIHLKHSYDIIITALPGIATKNFSEIKQEIGESFKQLK